MTYPDLHHVHTGWQAERAALPYNNYQSELTQCIEIRLPYTPFKLLIFPPKNYPYLWFKYTDGLQRSYDRMQVGHILDDTLNHPSSHKLALLIIDQDECIAGMRSSGPVNQVKQLAALEEMSQANTRPLAQQMNEWIPDGVVEPKGLWVNERHPSRALALQALTRACLYSAALFQCRYYVCTSPQQMTRVYINTVGLKVMEDVGVAPYPNASFKTRVGYVDLHNVLQACPEEQRLLIEKEWSLILHAKIRAPQSHLKHSYKACVLNSQNPFNKDLIHELQQEPNYQCNYLHNTLIKELNTLIPAPEESLRQEAMRWVIYPWSRKAIQMLGPLSFQRLRLDRNRNKITLKEQKQLGRLSIGVIGLSTGHVIAHTLAMEGLCGHLRLADFDELELSNLNRIPSNLLDLGENKALSTARRIAEIDPYLPIDLFTDGITQDNLADFLEGLDMVIEECDSLDLKLLVREGAAAKKIPVIMATSDQGLLDVERFDQEPKRQPLHGLVQAKASDLKGLSRSDKAGYGAAILEGDKISARLAASMIEIDETLTTWPQLASDVTQGAAMAATAVRLMGTGQTLNSSRVRYDMEALLQQTTLTEQTQQCPAPAAPVPTYSGDAKADILLASQYAPSPGNIQPWKLAWQNKQLYMALDRQRTTCMDVDYRGAYTALGAAALNAQIAAAHYHKLGVLQHFPSPEKPDLVCQLTLGTKTNDTLADLFPYLLKRHTNRHLAQRVPLSDETRQTLEQATSSYPVKLHWLSQPDELESYAELSIESDRLRHLCTHLNQDMYSEIVWPGRDKLDRGIDIRTLEMLPQDGHKLNVINRPDVMQQLSQWEAGHALGQYNRDRIHRAAAMLVITIKGGKPLDYVLGGQAIQHCWLIAEKLGLAVQPISPVFIYAQTEKDVDTLTQGHHKQTMMELQQRFIHLLQLAEAEYPVLVVRLTQAKPPSARSLREQLTNTHCPAHS